MWIAFLNPQGNFDPQDRRWGEHPDFGGQLVYVKEVALALGEMGHRVDLVTRQIQDPDWPGFEAPEDGYPGHPRVRILRIPCGPPTFLPKEELWPHLGTGWVPGILARYRAEGGLPDAFTAHYADGGLAAALIRARTGRPFTFTAHSLGAQKLERLLRQGGSLAELNRRYRFHRRLAAERVAMDHADRIVVSTRQERFEQYAHPAYAGAVDPADGRRFAVVPPGVNDRIFRPEPGPLDPRIEARIEAALARHLPPERRRLPLVLAGGRLDPKKNHVGLVEAFARDPRLRKGANLALVVRGADDPFRQIEALDPVAREVVRELGRRLEAYGLRTAFVPLRLEGQPELAAAYRVLARRRGCFALLSLYEPFGLGPLEAMACGLPAVVTRHGGPSESLQEGDRTFGILVEPTDPADVARGLRALLEDPAAWDRYRDLGLERVRSRYTWRRTAEGYLRVLEEILRGPRRRPTLPIPAWFTDPRPDLEPPLPAPFHS